MKCDVLLKSIFLASANCLVPAIVGSRPVEQLNVAFPDIQQRLPDLVMRLEDGRILHVELQSDNDPEMPLRMLDYRLFLMRRFPGLPVVQIVLYFGRMRLNMSSELSDEGLEFRFRLIDIREFPASRFLESPEPAGRILAILCQHRNPRKLTREIVASWSGCTARQRRDLIQKLVIASGLRQEYQAVRQELDMIREDSYRENLCFIDAKAEGIAEGQREALLELLADRFDTIPARTQRLIAKASSEQLTVWFRRALRASALADVFTKSAR